MTPAEANKIMNDARELAIKVLDMGNASEAAANIAMMILKEAKAKVDAVAFDLATLAG